MMGLPAATRSAAAADSWCQSAVFGLFHLRTGLALKTGVTARRLTLLLFLAAQGWDGIFTYVAVDAYGLGAEGNLLVATWMGLLGPAPALVGAKLGAAACGILLYMLGEHRALAALTVFYAVGAIVPWILIFQAH